MARLLYKHGSPLAYRPLTESNVTLHRPDLKANSVLER